MSSKPLSLHNLLRFYQTFCKRSKFQTSFLVTIWPLRWKIMLLTILRSQCSSFLCYYLERYSKYVLYSCRKGNKTSKITKPRRNFVNLSAYFEIAVENWKIKKIDQKLFGCLIWGIRNGISWDDFWILILVKKWNCLI